MCVWCKASVRPGKNMVCHLRTPCIPWIFWNILHIWVYWLQHTAMFLCCAHHHIWPPRLWCGIVGEFDLGGSWSAMFEFRAWGSKYMACPLGVCIPAIFGWQHFSLSVVVVWSPNEGDMYKLASATPTASNLAVRSSVRAVCPRRPPLLVFLQCFNWKLRGCWFFLPPVWYPDACNIISVWLDLSRSVQLFSGCPPKLTYSRSRLKCD